MVGEQKEGARTKNLKWTASVLRARAGISSKMAVPKKIAQRSRTRLKRANNGVLPRPDEGLRSRLAALDSERLQRQRHHQVKLLVQAAKKARTFLVRRLLRKAGEAGGSEAVSYTHLTLPTMLMV